MSSFIVGGGFLFAIVWLILSDLDLLPHISFIDRYYLIFLVIFIVVCEKKSKKQAYKLSDDEATLSL
ncbi:hypothetical protein Lpp7_09773 [Lacticaseibacillus paracasei subsp. paracasei Lpp7]|uniref:Uncharacterized protein n=1 Tax=Lacticaseibacillus paracasei subsp. paracasei Lpp7 TaxID=1256200 RepID=A0A8E0IGB6_LACPA|nr:hypothetical protein LCAUW1_2400 [Lacticaseibacillus paracasei]EPC51218.1 hypothetical protein Lpp7_09773 [Lacticaseibacillus paracasei subsp. paracasei Lpp7]